MSDADRLVAIGRVGRPHGLDGAFVVDGASEEAARWRIGQTVVVDGERATIAVSRRVGGGRRAIRLDREVARGTELAVRVRDLPPPAPDSYYAFQLVGLVVVDVAREELGRVRGVVPGAANDNLELEDGTLIPLIDDAICAVDLVAARIVVDGGFLA